MQFITSGDRIAVENFTIGDLYTITFVGGTYINTACIGKGADFVTFQRNLPELLFSLTMETAELVSSIDLYAGGTGTNNYNDLTNKPQIGGVELVGNKSLNDLGIQAEITEESPLTSALVSGLGSAAAADSSDFATAAQGALAASAIQSAGTGLTKSGTTLNHSNNVTAQMSASFSSITFDAQGHITGSTAATTAQLDAINSGVTSTDVAQIGINENNISLIEQMNGEKNLFNYNAWKSVDVYNGTKELVSDGIKLTATGNNCYTYCFSSGGLIYPTEARIPVTAGEIYVLLWDYTANSSQTNDLVYIFGNGEASIQSYTSAQTERLGYTIPSGVTYLTIRFGVTTSGNIATYKNIMLIKRSAYDAGFTDYQPFALPNTAITPALKECVDNGVKNLLDFSGSTPTSSSYATITDNKDGTYTATKTSSNTETPYIPAYLKAGTYIYSGCPANGSNDTYSLDIRTSTGTYIDGSSEYGNGVQVTIPSDGWYRIVIRFASTYTNTTGLTFKPMLCDPALWAVSHTFGPYTMNNVELTNNIVSINARYSDNANVQTDIDNLNKSGIYAVNNTTTFTEAVPYQYGTLFHMEMVWWRMQVMFFASTSYNKPIFRMSNTNTGGGAASVWNKWHYFDGTLVNP